MAKFDVLDMNGKKVSTVELSDAVFGITPNEKVMHMAVVNFLANQRQGTQSTKTRAEVSGGGRKPWKQKGTGRARQGSTRSPQWTHGGIALGPKPRDYSYRLNRKVKRLAVLSALSAKAQSGDIIVIDELSVNEYKTKTIVNMLTAVGATRKALIVTPSIDTKLVRSAGNIPGVTTTTADNINTHDVLNGGKFIISVNAAKKLEEVYTV
ncbi:MAG: 50S ribosomal protein L4 [Oscillospiraceae bacterium]